MFQKHLEQGHGILPMAPAPTPVTDGYHQVPIDGARPTTSHVSQYGIQSLKGLKDLVALLPIFDPMYGDQAPEYLSKLRYYSSTRDVSE